MGQEKDHPEQTLSETLFLEEIPGWVAVVRNDGKNYPVEIMSRSLRSYLQFDKASGARARLSDILRRFVDQSQAQKIMQDLVTVKNNSTPVFERVIDNFNQQDGQRASAIHLKVSAVKMVDANYSHLILLLTPINQLLTDLKATNQPAQDRRTLEESENKFRDLVMQAPVAIAVFRGENFVAEIANDSYLPLVGKTREEFVGLPLFESLPEAREALEPLARELVRTGKPFPATEFELVLNRYGKDELCFFNSVWEPLRNQEGVVDGFMVVAHEVTDQVLWRRKVEESEARLRSIISTAPAAIGLFVGRDLVVELPNQAFIDIVGKGPDISGKPLREVMPELISEDQPFLQILDEVYTSGKMFQTNGTQVKITKNGVLTNNYYDFTYTPLLDSNGNVYAILDIAIDVTEQVLGRLRIEESEQRVRALVESAPFPIGVYKGREMRIEMANQSMLDTWGKGNDVIGKLYSDVLPELDNQEVFNQLEQVYQTGVPFHARNQRIDLVIKGSLQPFFFNYSLTPVFDSGGKVYAVMNTAADVTDLNMAKIKIEESERNLRGMILKAPFPICILRGRDFTIEIANTSMMDFFVQKKAELINKPLFEAVEELRNQGYEDLLEQVLTTGQPFSAQELPVTLPRNGELVTYFINFAFEPLIESADTVSGIMVMAVDVTEQVIARMKIEKLVLERTRELAEANDALIKTNEELSRSNVNLEEFAYAASHDLKEPIRKIYFFGDRLKNALHDRLKSEELRYFERMESAARRMSTLIDDLLSYSQVGLRPQTFDELDMNELLEQVLGDLDLEIEEKSALVSVAPLFKYKGYRRQLQQAFQNIISNSLKYSQNGIAPQINIEYQTLQGSETGFPLSREEQHHKFHVITVRDNGIGFDQKDADRIFNVFTRLHGDGDQRGTGVGLSIVRKVVENHEGYVKAEGRPGEGAIFTILLPG